MAKKNFSGGLDSLLGGSPLSKSAETSKPKEEPVKKVEKVTPPVPKTASFGLTKEQQDKITALAQKEGRPEDEIIREAISFYLDFQVDL
ncbi:ribbon-helix-helix protein, CopG family [Flammeovirga aprica]|uniref:CopG family transcriptional regulator n=1 Tax=Flammeovirga aprica JL-4 TaxID=694437 RepID=A0A7X9XC84_9BACT|nr:ribbon-helix-helix protein, CopG family [Flammeovirga aprica]NME71485.1 CopG family transcriptional regulator [Flammeovirga aprica JL-4]